MNATLVKALIGFGGFVIGGAAGFFVGHKWTARAYEDILQAEIEDVKKSFDEQYNALKVHINDVYGCKEATPTFRESLKLDERDDLKPLPDEPEEDYVGEVKRYNPKVDYTKASTPAKKPLETVHTNVFDESAKVRRDPIQGINPDPYEISEEYYHTDRMDLDKHELFYYPDDDCVMEDDGTIVDDDLIAKWLTSDFVESLAASERMGEHSIYIRNEGEMTDYAVHVAYNRKG